MGNYRIIAVAAVLALLGSVVKGAFDAWTLTSDLRLRDEGVVVSGTVVSKRRVDRGRQAFSFVTLKYTDQGGTTRTKEAPVVTTSGLDEGEVVQVRYDPDDPDRVLPVDEVIRVQRPVIQLVIDGMAFVAGLIALVVSSVLRRKEEQRLRAL